MTNYIPQIGDIILEDSQRFGAKCVKFLMQSPTIWHQIYRWITGQLEHVSYYHVAMMLKKTSKDVIEIVEQQKTVQIDDWNPNVKQIIFRKINLTNDEQTELFQEAYVSLGQGYDILNVFGNLFTWLTGIKWFCRYMEAKNKDICVNRVASYYWNTTSERFGVKTHSELTTHTLYKYLLDNPNWEVVYIKN